MGINGGWNYIETARDRAAYVNMHIQVSRIGHEPHIVVVSYVDICSTVDKKDEGLCLDTGMHQRCPTELYRRQSGVSHCERETIAHRV